MIIGSVPVTEATQRSSSRPVRLDVNEVLRANVRAEWEAFKNRDKKAYGDLLADDFVAVEDDGDGARNKIHAVGEIAASNIQNYSLAFFKCVPLSPQAAFVTYEVTMEFPTRAVNRLKRLLVGELWIERDGRWRARHYQETRVR
jgi:ketosteroid isomerase-like protein